eukprot:g145.t1
MKGGAIRFVLCSVKGCVERRDVDIRGCASGLAAIVNLACDDDNVLELLDGGVASLITYCLVNVAVEKKGTEYANDVSGVRKAALRAITALCSGSGDVPPLGKEVMKRSFAEFHAQRTMDVVMGMIKQNMANPLVQYECCEALCAMSSPPDLLRIFSSSVRGRLCRSVIIDVFSRIHLSRGTPAHPIVYVATLVVGNLAWDTFCRDSMVRFGACEIVTKVLNRVSMVEHWDMPRAACVAITNLCNDSVENAALLGNAGACDVAIRALNCVSATQRRDGGIFEQGLNAIIALGEAPGNRERLCRLLSRKLRGAKYPVALRSRLRGLCGLMSELSDAEDSRASAYS